ncbi:MAG: Na(+)-translocating NADH-quinone reductase subunit A [Paludibacteraceae bacterium]|nr:Na(+)-translocating NADH-quinone reductase subunit A [Paludibacteraceae bacterium]
MQQINLKRGLDLPMDGKAELMLGSISRPDVFRIVPDHFAGITPKLEVKVGDRVKAGSPLFHDKAFEAMLFTSPVSGVVQDIVRGDRRKIMSINIAADATIEYEDFKAQVGAIQTQEDVKSILLQSGLWSLIKQRPYDCIALPNKEPQAIFISSFCSAPLAPDYEWVLKGQGAILQSAVTALSKIATVYVGIRHGAAAPEFRGLKDCVLYEVAGAHPAGNPSVQINHIRPMKQGETIWTIGIQDLALIGRLFAKGIVDMQKKVALVGPMAYGKMYYNVLPGMPVSALLESNYHKEVPCRFIAGNALSGHQIGMDDVISVYPNMYTVIGEGSDTHEFMGWMFPRFNAFHFGLTDPAKMIADNCMMKWLFGERKYQWDARLKGGRRAIIVSGEYDKVFPMDIYPEQLIKAMIALNLDKMIELGANEVAPEDFALCEYVCTSKMPLQAIAREALDYMRKEIE